MISLATMGKFWSQPDGGGLIQNTGSTSYFAEEKKSPVVIVDQVIEEEAKEILINIDGVYYD